MQPVRDRVLAVRYDGWPALGGDVRLELGRARTVLVGRNAAGKSLLLESLMSGARMATSDGGYRDPGGPASLTFDLEVDGVRQEYGFVRTVIPPDEESGRPQLEWRERCIRSDTGASVWRTDGGGVVLGDGSQFPLLGSQGMLHSSEGALHLPIASTVERMLEQRAYVGLTVFGSQMPDESKLVAQYGPCHRDVLRWGLDPETSCVAPGCTDPYADAPISWTLKDAAWAFGEPVMSHMPTCNKGNEPDKGCFGSGTYVHTALERVQQNLAAYKAACANDPEAPCDAGTQFVNLMIVDGMPNSTEAQYMAPLTAMFDEGVVTHVIGFGDGVDGVNAIAALNKMAGYGSGGARMYYDANSQAQLEQAILQAVLTIDFSGC